MDDPSDKPNGKFDPSAEPLGNPEEILAEEFFAYDPEVVVSIRQPISHRLVPPQLAGYLRERSRHLPKLHQRVLDLYYFKGRSIMDIARVCHISEVEAMRLEAECLREVHEAMQELASLG